MYPISTIGNVGAPFDGPVDPKKVATLVLVPALVVVALVGITYVIVKKR